MLSCKACGHEWDGHLIAPEKLPIEINAAVEEMMRNTYPNCGAGAKQLAIGTGKAREVNHD